MVEKPRHHTSLLLPRQQCHRRRCSESGIDLALNAHKETGLICQPTDLMAAKPTRLNLASGTCPGSGIELDIKNGPRPRRDKDMTVSWVRGHIGISGNEKADLEAAFQSITGTVASPKLTARTESSGQGSKEILQIRTRVWPVQNELEPPQSLRAHLDSHE